MPTPPVPDVFEPIRRRAAFSGQYKSKGPQKPCGPFQFKSPPARCDRRALGVAEAALVQEAVRDSHHDARLRLPAIR
jgi:hypothetical protein